jgi:hypothetical protein
MQMVRKRFMFEINGSIPADSREADHSEKIESMSSTTVATPQTLSTEQFLPAVHGAKPRTAVFDFDGTLWPGDAGSGFMRWTIDTGLLSPEAAERILGRHAAYHRGEVDEITICGEMTSIYAGLSEKAIRESAAQYFIDHVQPKFFPEMVQLVHDLQAAGVEVGRSRPRITG